MKLHISQLQQTLDQESYLFLACEAELDAKGFVETDNLRLWTKIGLFREGLISHDECFSHHFRQLPSFVGFPWNLCKDCSGKDAFGYSWRHDFYGPELTWTRQQCRMSDQEGYRFCVTTRHKKYKLVHWIWWPHVTVGYGTEIEFTLEQHDKQENCCCDSQSYLTTTNTHDR